MSRALLAIAVGIIKGGLETWLKEHPDATLADKVKEAFRLTCTDDAWFMGVPEIGERFDAAVNAVFLLTPEGDDRERLEIEMKLIKMMNAMLGGIPVDISLSPAPEDFEPLGMIDMFKKAADAAGVKRR